MRLSLLFSLCLLVLAGCDVGIDRSFAVSQRGISVQENCNPDLDECGYVPPSVLTAQESIDAINIITENAFERMFIQSEVDLFVNLALLDSTKNLLENAGVMFTASELESLEMHVLNLRIKNVDYSVFWAASSASVEQNAENFALQYCGVLPSDEQSTTARAKCRTEAIEAASRVVGMGFGAGAVMAGAVGVGMGVAYTSWLGYSQALYNLGYCMYSR